MNPTNSTLNMDHVDHAAPQGVATAGNADRSTIDADQTRIATVGDLARLVGVSNENRIRAWRRMGAPRDLDAVAWIRWLRTSGKGERAQRLAVGLGLMDRDSPSHPAPIAAPAAVPTRDEGPSPRDALNHERALLARAQRLRVEGRLVDRAVVERLLDDAGRIIVEELRVGYWTAFCSILEGKDPSLYGPLRKHHEACLAALALRLQPRLKELLPPTAPVEGPADA